MPSRIHPRSFGEAMTKANKEDADRADDIGCALFFGVVFVMLGIGHIWGAAHGFLAGGIAILVLVFATLIRR